MTTSLADVAAVLERHHPDLDRAVVDVAAGLATELSQASEDPVWSPASVLERARVVAELRLDPAAVAACILAPSKEPGALVPDGFTARADEALGQEVAALLAGVGKVFSIRWDRLEEAAAESLRKMFLAMARDVRVVLVVLARQVQKMRALAHAGLPTEEADRHARETYEAFAPLANRLGVWQLKWELEDAALRQLEPEQYQAIAKSVAETRAERDAFIAGVIETIRTRLAEEGIEATVKGRAKHIYSIWKKMERKQVGFDQIFDVTAVRVLTDKLTDCYAALGIVHSSWIPIPAEFDDYIAKPKANNYQSLHTAVLGPGGKAFEVQIRTHEMHHFAEFGVAAHWAYKEQKKSKSADRKFMLLRQLMDWEREVNDPHDFVESLKTDIFEDQVYVFTPNGDIVDLPAGSTPLDFAYRIHTSVGHRCRGARVNDAIQPLDYVLETGDRISILTQKQEKPSRDWMNPSFHFLRTSSARTKVRQWFRAQARDSAEIQGRELVDKELGRLELQFATLDDVVEALKYRKVEDLYAAVGYGDRSSQSIAAAALQVEHDKAPPEDPPVPPSVPEEKRKRSTSGLSMGGVDDILGKRARCCNPVPGDVVKGFVTRGRGIVIHRSDCVHIVSSDEPERVVDIEWGPTQGERHLVDVEIHAQDRPGLLRDLSNLVHTAGVNVSSARAESNKGGTAWLKLTLEFTSSEQVVRVLQRLDQVPYVDRVRRVAK